MTLVFSKPLNGTEEWVDLVLASAVIAVILDVVNLFAFADLFEEGRKKRSSGSGSRRTPSLQEVFTPKEKLRRDMVLKVSFVSMVTLSLLMTRIIYCILYKAKIVILKMK